MVRLKDTASGRNEAVDVEQGQQQDNDSCKRFFHDPIMYQQALISYDFS